MRTLLVSINAKYEHENPAPWYLKAACDAKNGACGKVDVLSRTINDDPQRVYAAVVDVKPDCVGLSCYIWNRDLQLRLCADLKAAFPEMLIFCGGPEVSHADGGDAFLEAGAFCVLAGEGETRLPELLLMLNAGQTPNREQLAQWQALPPPMDGNTLFSPCSSEYLAVLNGRIAYIESSRGCPYQCSYCLSSESRGMSWIPLERVYEELDQLVEAGVRTVKFVDRTFNLSDDRALPVWKYLVRYKGRGCVFHFEVAPDLLTDIQLRQLAAMPKGLVQIEAGFQSVHPGTLIRVGRQMDVEKALNQLSRVVTVGNVHVHADLIAGLPGETPEQVASSVNRLESIQPHHLQLGFLKLIRGTRIRRETARWGYVCRSYAPYEVLASGSINPQEMLKLKEVEESMERFRNSGKFLLTLQWLIKWHASPYDLYRALADWMKVNGLLGRPISSDRLFKCMAGYMEQRILHQDRPECIRREYLQRPPIASQLEDRPTGMGLLRLDWVCAHRNPFLPDWLTQGIEPQLPETNHVVEAYGLESGCTHSGKKALRNRYHAAEVFLPGEVRNGVRSVCERDRGTGRHRVLVDVHETSPVLGRPDIVILPKG